MEISIEVMGYETLASIHLSW